MQKWKKEKGGKKEEKRKGEEEKFNHRETAKHQNCSGSTWLPLYTDQTGNMRKRSKEKEK